MAPVEALSSVGEEGDGGQAEDCPALLHMEHWRHQPLFPPRECSPDGSSMQLQHAEEEGGCPHLPGQRQSPSQAQLGLSHLSASTIECPPAAQLSLESLDSVFKQRNSSECVEFPGEKRVTGKGVCVEGKCRACGHTSIQQKLLSPSEVLGVALGLRETPGNRTVEVPALWKLPLQQERSHHPMHTQCA